MSSFLIFFSLPFADFAPFVQCAVSVQYAHRGCSNNSEAFGLSKTPPSHCAVHASYFDCAAEDGAYLKAEWVRRDQCMFSKTVGCEGRVTVSGELRGGAPRVQ